MAWADATASVTAMAQQEPARYTPCRHEQRRTWESGNFGIDWQRSRERTIIYETVARQLSFVILKPDFNYNETALSGPSRQKIIQHSHIA